MSENTRKIVDYAINDQGSDLRDALYAEIHDRVSAHFEASKIALAKNLFATEETITEDDEEDAGMEGDEDEEGECSSKKKMKKESYDEEDDEEFEEEDEEDE